MRIFDLHADIGWDILHKEEQGCNDALQNEHLPKLEAGEIQGVCIASFFDGSEDWQQMQKMVETSRRQISELFPDITWIKSQADLNDDNKIKLLMSVEGMCGIVDDVEAKIQWLYDQGVRVASLCWNEKNALANGVKGDVCQGLSASGKLVIKKMEELGANLPAILTGDFNVDQTHQSYDALVSKGVLCDAYEKADFRYATNGTFNSFDPNNFTESRIDHVFVSPVFHVKKYGVLTDTYRSEKEKKQKADVKDAPQEITVKAYQARTPSDHFPVKVVLEYNRK